ncbi:transglutaminase-like putative cysteine protease [Lysinibacillus composti]|uniref:DUF5050 domain-containing protein n=1 Tax=Lysinibacillus composti TaxID=720633 RepID=A0A3N9U2Q0_9BACI|nr:transglutaminase domain-containing protein [Lysinibacillus composti]MBM7610729.1 transglutaminase-like putative cysteine protease [Lysinibacillus composti]RQW70933.1 DUF5050 domain-containing protein [Lysinibacillus composti]
MLKRITLVVILLVFIKPAYDYGKQILSDAQNILSEDNVITDVTSKVLSGEVMKDIEKTVTNSVEESQSPMVATTSGAVLPDKVNSVEALTDAFYYYFSQWETNFTIHYVGSTSDIENIIERATKDAAARDQYIQGHLSDRKIEYEYSKLDAKITVHQQYLTNAAQEEIVNREVASILSTISPESMTDFEKVKFVNDYIVKNTAYSTETTISPHSACAVLQEGKGVCQGYALLALKMLQELGVETKYVVGEVYTGGHAWNLVKVDGQWYHLDTTWNDPVPDRKNIVSYKYFLTTDAKMKLDHSWNQSDYPTATNDKYTVMSQVDHAYEVDGAIYYSNVDDNHKLYILDLSTGKTKRLTEARAQFIVGYGNWIYFSNYSNGAFLTKIKTNGTEQSIVYRDEVKDLFIEDGFLYFHTPDGLKQMEL